MSKKLRILIIFFITTSAQAHLVDRGGGLIYDDDQNILWLADANLAASNTFGLPVGESLGPHPLDDSGQSGQINEDGTANWAGAFHFIDAMNAAKYLGFSDWRLPATQQPDPSCSTQTDPGNGYPLQGSGTDCLGSEMGYLFNDEQISSLAPGPFFSHIMASAYWSRTESVPFPDSVWSMNFFSGEQNLTGNADSHFIWAVRDGDINDDGLPGDITSISDISGDTVPEIAYLDEQDNQPRIRYYSGADHNKIQGVRYFSRDWTRVAAATITDGNGDGLAIDPAVAVLAYSGTRAVQVRWAATGATVGNSVRFLNSDWTVIDVAVIEDVNGDGVSGDTAIAVLGVNESLVFNEQIQVQVRWFSDGSKLATWRFFNGNWEPRALEVVHRIGASPLLAVLANKPATGANMVQARRLNKGSLHRDTSFWSPGWEARDIGILLDADGNGVADDPAYLVLAHHRATNRNKVQIRRVSDGMKIKKINMQGKDWSAWRVTSSGDISGNLYEEVGSLSENISDGTLSIKLKDYDDRTTTATISP